MKRRSEDAVSGCLLGGAVGDALGAPVEFLSLKQIRDTYGPDGIKSYDKRNHRGLAEFTDDTQMTLFTAEALVIAKEKANGAEIADSSTGIHHAYLRWLETQEQSFREIADRPETEGWLLSIKEMWKVKAPGNTCLSALRSGKGGTPSQPINNSKGCGGVMRVAPIGLLFSGEKAFVEGMKAAAITHGHPSGYLPAGCLAQMIANILHSDLSSDPEEVLQDSTWAVLATLRKWPGHAETENAICSALDLANACGSQATPEMVESLGGAWIGEEALAIALFCALVYPRDFQSGVLLAVNHSGDSDSTGAICGNILGALNGARAIPTEWLNDIELGSQIRDISRRLMD